MTNNIVIALSVILLSVLPSVSAYAQNDDPPTETATEVASDLASSTGVQQTSHRREKESIRRSSEGFVRAFDAGDGKAVASLWAEDGDYVDETGRSFSGRAAIEAEYARFFSQHPGTKMQIIIDSIRILNDAAAIEDGRAILEPPPAGTPAISKYTVVHVKLNGKWLMSTVRDTRVEIPSTYRNLEDLEWLIGSWSAEEHGSKMDAKCRWIANKSFLKRTYSVTHPDQQTTSGLQIIGWNPQIGQIESWSFTSGGGHAVAVWTPIENGWAIETAGTLPDGTSSSSINIMSRLDDNACTWKSVQRSAGSLSLPDTDEIVLKRQTAAK